MSRPTRTRNLAALAAALVAAALLLVVAQPVQPARLDAAPVDLAVPALSPDELGRWCADRKAQGTAGLSSRARAWLDDCITLFGAGLAPSPTATPTAAPTATATPTSSPTASPTATATTTATPEPTPTPTATTGTGCAATPSACGFPDATNTGPVGTALLEVTGNVTIATAGAVLENRDVAGCITVTAPNVTIRNVRVRCAGGYAIDYFGQGGGVLTVEDTEVDCLGSRGTAIGELALVVRRVDVHGCENGFDVDHTADIRDTWCHDLVDEWVVSEAHTDCVQGQMYYSVTIAHNTLAPGKYTTSAIEGDCGSCGTIVRTGWVVKGNLLSGGTFTVYCTARSEEAGSLVTNNRFAGGFQYGYATNCADPDVLWSGNVSDSDGGSLGAL